MNQFPSLGITNTTFIHFRETDTQADTTEQSQQLLKCKNQVFSPLEVARVVYQTPYNFVVNS